MTDTVIIKRKVKRDFTTLPNDLIRDSRLSWGALGLLVYILSLPDDFKLRLVHLSKQKACGRDATRARAKELEEAGYLFINQERDAHGRFLRTLWEVSDTPWTATPAPPCSDIPKSAEPKTENPDTVIPPSVYPTLLNTNTEQVLKEKRTTTTKDIETEQKPAHAGLEFPVGMPTSDTASLAKALAAVPIDDAQALLDELAGAMSQKNVIRTTPLRWFHGLLKRYEKGLFCPTNPQPAKAREKRNQVASAPRPEETKEIAMAHLKSLKAGLGRSFAQ